MIQNNKKGPFHPFLLFHLSNHIVFIVLKAIFCIIIIDPRYYLFHFLFETLWTLYRLLQEFATECLCTQKVGKMKNLESRSKTVEQNLFWFLGVKSLMLVHSLGGAQFCFWNFSVSFTLYFVLCMIHTIYVMVGTDNCH